MTFFYPVTPVRGLMILTIVSTSLLAVSDEGRAQAREWSANGFKESVVVADCRDCGDDIGMMVECRGQTQPALVTVHWAAAETGRDLATTPVTIEIDGEVFQRNGTTVYFGQLGYVPTFELRPNDPLLAALQQGGSANISSGPGSTSISLRGSGEAFEVFKVHCGWNRLPANNQGGFNQPQGNQPTSNQPQGQPAGVPGTDTANTANEDGSKWFIIEFDAANSGKTGASLVFGIPETDAIAINATCEAGNPGPFVPVMALVDLGGMPNGLPVQVQVRAGAFNQTYQGTVSFLSEEYSGAQLAIPVDDPFWAVLDSGQPVSIGATGKQPVTLHAPGSVDAVSSFLDRCQTIFRG